MGKVKLIVIVATASDRSKRTLHAIEDCSFHRRSCAVKFWELVDLMLASRNQPVVGEVHNLRVEKKHTFKS